MNNTFIIIFFFSISLFSQELKININNQEIFLKTNNFEEKLLIKNDTILSLNPGIYNFYNDSLDFVIFLDTLKNYNLSFSSKNGVFFDGLEDSEFQFFNQFFSYYKLLIDPVLHSNFSPDQYEIFMYDVKNKLNDFLEKEDPKFQKLNEKHYVFLSNYINYSYYNSLCNYIINNNDSNQLFSYNLIPYFLEESIYFNALTKKLNFSLYKDYIYNMTRLLTYKTYSTTNQSIRVFFSSFLQFAKKHLTQDQLNYCLSKFIFEYSSEIEKSLFDEIFGLLNTISETEKEYILNFYNKNQDKINSIENVFVVKNYDFYLEDVFGKEISLDDYSGKVLYIDIWASWCGPCRKLFPFSSSLKKRFKKRDLKKISFIYVSIDNDYNKWKKSINDLDIDGENFISPSDKNNGIGQYFQVSSIPRYIIIDKGGDIVEQNAKRPNDDTLFDDLLELINE